MKRNLLFHTKKKLLLFLIIGAPFIGTSQVSNPESSYSPLPQTGFVATVDATDSTELTTNDAFALVDGKNATFWETPWHGTSLLPHWFMIDMNGTTQNIDGVYIVDRNNKGNSPLTCTVSTSTDGVTFTQQGGTFTLPFDGGQSKIPLKFPATVNCRYYKVIITANQTTGNNVTNVAETGALIKTVPDNTAYSRTSWIATACSEELTGEGAVNGRAATSIDNNQATYWASAWSGATPDYTYPHYIIIDMGVAQPVNIISYQNRASGSNSWPYTGDISFSDDGTTWLSPVWGHTINPVDTFKFSSNQERINLPDVQNHRYFRVQIDSNRYAHLFPNNAISNPSGFYPTSLAEIRAHYDASLPVTLTSFTAQINAGEVHLNWQTAGEHNSDHFNVTRSTDGVNFTTVGKVTAAGNSNVVHNYSYIDATPLQGTNFYQLQQVDKDGKSTLSNTVSVRNLSGDISLKIESQGTQNLVLQVNSQNATSGTIKIFSSTGVVISSQSIQLLKGSNNVFVPLNAASGVYIISLITSKSVISARFVK